MSIKCNLPVEDRAEIWKGFSEYLCPEEEQRIGKLFKGHMFFRGDGKKTRHFFCDKCDTYFSEEQDMHNSGLFQKHGSVTRCPHCGDVVELVAEGKIRSGKTLEEKICVMVIRVDEDGAVRLMAGIAMKEFFREAYYELRPYISFIPTKYYYFKQGVRQCWTKSYAWYCGYPAIEKEWTAEPNIRSAFVPGMGYSDAFDGYCNIIGSEKLEESFAKYSMAIGWLNDCDYIHDADRHQGLEKYLGCYVEYPQMEFAMKMGQRQVVNDLVFRGVKNHRIINWKASSLPEVYRMNKQEYKTFIKKGGTLDMLRLAKKLKRDIWQVISVRDFFESSDEGKIEKFYQEIEKVNSTAEDSLKYLRRQKMKPKEAWQHWADYLDMAGKLGYDLTNLEVSMPRNLQTAHDTAASILQIQTNAERAKIYRKRKSQLKKRYEMEYGGMCIRVPEKASDIAQEGEKLHHCVGGYADRHIHGETTILFLRDAKKPDESLVTIEMMPDGVTIKQIHGWCNDLQPKDGKWLGNPKVVYQEFLDVWLDWIKAGSKRTSTGEPILNIHKEAKTA